MSGSLAHLATCSFIDLTAARRKREDNIVQLRKDRRDENLQKKRMVGAVVAAGEMESNRPMMQQKVIKRALSFEESLPATLAWYWIATAGSLADRVQLESLPAMVQGVWSEDHQAQLEATTQFRKLLSIGT